MASTMGATTLRALGALAAPLAVLALILATVLPSHPVSAASEAHPASSHTTAPASPAAGPHSTGHHAAGHHTAATHFAASPGDSGGPAGGPSDAPNGTHQDGTHHDGHASDHPMCHPDDELPSVSPDRCGSRPTHELAFVPHPLPVTSGPACRDLAPGQTRAGSRPHGAALLTVVCVSRT